MFYRKFLGLTGEFAKTAGHKANGGEGTRHSTRQDPARTESVCRERSRADTEVLGMRSFSDCL